jgi:hypothetical protein
VCSSDLDFVYNQLPIAGLGQIPYVDDFYEELAQVMLGKYYSFILTLTQSGSVVYRIAGWDVPEEDMQKYSINEKMAGYYDATNTDNYIAGNGQLCAYPLFYSKFLTFEYGIEAAQPSIPIFYIKTDSFKIVYKLGYPYSDDHYWSRN